MKRIPKTPVEFDYDLWTTEDGKCMVRVKITGEVTEVDREVMKILRAEEKMLRRSYGSDGASEDEDGEEKTSDAVLSLDASGMYVDLKEGLLSDAEYSHHKEIVMEDIRAIERNLSELEAPKNQTEEQITGEMKWKQMIRRFHDATEISEEMADAFIETMKIHEDGTLEIKLSYMDEFAALTKTCEKIRKEVA